VNDWRKSSYSNGTGGDCVEAASGDGGVLVRDTADRGGGTLAFAPETWLAFVTGLK
jgi:hypothetical protein